MSDHRPPGALSSSSRLHVTAAATPEAADAQRDLVRRYGQAPIETADVIVALRGDGFLIETLHETLHRRDPVFILGQASGLIIYFRNLQFLWRARKGAGAPTQEG